MEHEEDILAKAVEQLRSEPIEPHPPQSVVDATLRKLTAPGAPRRPQDTTFIKLTARVAAAAAVLVFAGYALGRLSAPDPPDLEQLESSLLASLTSSIEPVVRERVTEDLRQQWQAALTGSYVQLKADLTQQHRDDLNRFAIQTLAASNAVTNQLLGELVQNLDTAQTEKMQWVAGALDQIERSRLKDKSQLAAGLEALAYRTEDGLQQTREDLVHLLAGTRPSPAPKVEERID